MVGSTGGVDDTPVYDFLGQEIKVGDRVVYSSSYGPDMSWGTIGRVTPNRVYMSAGAGSWKHPENVIVLDQDAVLQLSLTGAFGKGGNGKTINR